MALDSILSTPVTTPPPKGASSSTTGGSSGGSDSSGSSTSTSSASGSGATNAASHSNESASGKATKGKGNSASRGANSSSQSQNASSSAKARQSNATNQAQAAGASAQNTAAQNKNPGPSFIDALAQTQADAQDSAAATAAAAPQEVTGSIGRQNGAKGTKDDHTDTTGTALGFLSQSLAAAMAGLQPTSPEQKPAANTATTDDDSADAVSLAGGGSTIQSVVANIAQGAAEGLKAATTATDGKADTSSATSAPDGSAAAANAFQAHMAARAQSAANADALNNKVTTPVGDTGFANEVGDKITWMANQGVQSASLQMTPEHLGPVEVRISMQGGSASVTFNAAHADTRAALEQALPRLREMFSTQGLTLTDASVSQQSPRGQQQRQAVSAIGAIGGVSGDDSTSSVTSVTRAQLGLVDTYA